MLTEMALSGAVFLSPGCSSARYPIPLLTLHRLFLLLPNHHALIKDALPFWGWRLGCAILCTGNELGQHNLSSTTLTPVPADVGHRRANWLAFGFCFL